MRRSLATTRRSARKHLRVRPRGNPGGMKHPFAVGVAVGVGSVLVLAYFVGRAASNIYT